MFMGLGMVWTIMTRVYVNVIVAYIHVDVTDVGGNGFEIENILENKDKKMH